MKTPNDLPEKAENLLRGLVGTNLDPSMSDQVALTNELSIHMMDLEIQNEASRMVRRAESSASSNWNAFASSCPISSG
jgi:hypothetical protein